jgi:iron complex outermembrane receptor protein
MKFIAATYLAGSCLVAVAIASQPALGQTVAEPSPPTQPAQAASAPIDEAGKGEIIVTAQRRSESLQRTPVAVSVLTGAALAQRAITSETDLQTATPGLTVRASQNSNQLNYAIRGQSVDAFSNTRPGVLPYFNELPLSGGIAGGSAFYDLGSIQVLKGPQGTLFGRNATGGAVLFTTARPEKDFGGYALGRVGNYRAVQLEGALNIPIVEDAVILRLAGVHQYRRGVQKNVHPFCKQPHPLFPLADDPALSSLPDDNSCRIGTVDRTGGRATLLVRPSEGIENTLTVDYLKSGGSSTTGVLYNLHPPGLVPSIAFTDVAPTGVANYPLGPGAAAAYLAATPHLPDGGLPEFLALQKARGPYVADIDGLNSFRAKNLLISNSTTIDIGENTQIKNVFGYINTDSTVYSDIDGTPFGLDNNGFYKVTANGESLGRRDKLRQFSEELQLLGTTAGERLKYVVGVFYADEKTYNLTTSDLFDFPIIRLIQTSEFERGNKTYAGYAQGTYDLSDLVGQGLSFTAGVRYTDEKITLHFLPRDFHFDSPQPGYEFDMARSFNSWSWTLGLQYQVTPDTLLYAANRRSYRHGGLNGLVNPFPTFTDDGGAIYRTEAVTDAELGIKHQGRGPIPYHINLAVYQNWIKNAQRVAYTLVTGAPAAVTVNVPKARVRGVELDGQVSPTEWLTIGGQLNYTDAKFTDNLVSVAGGAPVEFGTYPDTPKWSGAAFAEVTVPVQDNIDVTLRGDVFAQTSNFFSSTGNLNPGAKIPGYEVVNFRIGLGDSEAGWSLAGIVKNAFKKVYYVGGVALGELFQTNSAVPGDPRTFLVEARYRF